MISVDVFTSTSMGRTLHITSVIGIFEGVEKRREAKN